MTAALPVPIRRSLDLLPAPLLRHLMYLRRFGRWGNFREPRMFTEHLTRRMLTDRSPEIAWTCDKRAMKEHARRRAPWVRTPATLWHGTDLAELDPSALPARWVLKPNHSSKAVHFGGPGARIEDLRRATRGWLRTYDRAGVGEWAYTRARRELLVEEQIGDGDVLVDYKFFVFQGRVELLHTDSGRFTDTLYEVFYTRDWEPLAIANGAVPGPLREKPRCWAAMVAAAEAIGAGYDFMRVDLYEHDGVPWFGEMTPYPSGGMDIFEPASVDRSLGSLWARGSVEEPASPPLPRRSSPARSGAAEAEMPQTVDGRATGR